MHVRGFIFCLIAILTAGGASLSRLAQSAEGERSDGSALPGVTVEHGPTCSQPRVTTTEHNGEYQLPGCSGTYTVTFTWAECRPESQSGSDRLQNTPPT